MDHVALGEHAAAAGDAGGLAGPQHHVAHIVDVIQQAAGLLVHERAGAGGTVTVRLIVVDAHATRIRVCLKADELARLAAHLEDGDRLGMQGVQAASDGLELVLVEGAQSLADEAPAGSGDAHAADRFARHDGQHLVQQCSRGFRRAALDATVARDEHGAAVRRRQAALRQHEELGMRGGQVMEALTVRLVSHESELETDAAYVDADEGHGETAVPPRSLLRGERRRPSDRRTRARCPARPGLDGSMPGSLPQDGLY